MDGYQMMDQLLYPCYIGLSEIIEMEEASTDVIDIEIPDDSE